MSDSKKIGFSSFSFSFFIQTAFRANLFFDDEFLLKNNVYLDSFHGFTFFFTSGASDFGRPVRFISFYRIISSGICYFTRYHISNILYYFIFLTLAYFFSKRMFDDLAFAFVVALYLSSPTRFHTEGAHISGRKRRACRNIFLCTTICFDSFLQPGKANRALDRSFFLLAIEPRKPMWTSRLILYAPIQIFRINPLFQFQKLFYYIFLIMVAGMFLLMVLLIRNRPFFDYLNTIPIYGNNQGINFATAAKICAIILSLAIFPFGLSAD